MRHVRQTSNPVFQTAEAIIRRSRRGFDQGVAKSMCVCLRLGSQVNKVGANKWTLCQGHEIAWLTSDTRVCK